MCLAIAIPASAANAEVYADPIGASSEMVSVPLFIRDNPGLMGFKLIVKYDGGVLQPQTVTRGTVTQSGMMNDSIGTSQDGTLLIVWSDTDAVKADGTLAVLTFKASKQTDTTLTVSYSQADTFDGDFNDVTLDCKPVEIRFGSEATTTMPVAKQPDHRDIIAAVDSVKNKTDVSAVNKAIARLTGTEDLYAKPEEVQSAYSAAVADNFVETALLAVDGETIDAVIQSALWEVGAKTVDTVPPDKQAAFIASVETALREEASDVPRISDAMTVEEAVQAIEMLQQKNEESAKEGIHVPQPKDKQSGKPWILFGVCVAIVIAGAFCAILVYRGRKMKGDKTK